MGEREGLLNFMVAGMVAHLEDLLQASRAASLRENTLIRARLIVNAAGIEFRHVKYFVTLRKTFSKLMLMFPEIFASCTIINAPWAIKALYRAVDSILTNVQRRKLRICGGDFADSLYEHTGIELAALPTCLGGSNTDHGLPAAAPVLVGAGRAVGGSLHFGWPWE